MYVAFPWMSSPALPLAAESIIHYHYGSKSDGEKYASGVDKSENAIHMALPRFSSPSSFAALNDLGQG